LTRCAYIVGRATGQQVGLPHRNGVDAQLLGHLGEQRLEGARVSTVPWPRIAPQGGRLV
jgi:hypothetical protein